MRSDAPLTPAISGRQYLRDRASGRAGIRATPTSARINPRRPGATRTARRPAGWQQRPGPAGSAAGAARPSRGVDADTGQCGAGARGVRSVRSKWHDRLTEYGRRKHHPDVPEVDADGNCHGEDGPNMRNDSLPGLTPRAIPSDPEGLPAETRASPTESRSTSPCTPRGRRSLVPAPRAGPAGDGPCCGSPARFTSVSQLIGG